MKILLLEEESSGQPFNVVTEVTEVDSCIEDFGVDSIHWNFEKECCIYPRIFIDALFRIHEVLFTVLSPFIVSSTLFTVYFFIPFKFH